MNNDRPRGLRALLLTLLVACGSNDLKRPVDAVPANGGLAGFQLGEPAALTEPRFQPVPDAARTYQLADVSGLSIGGQPMEQALFTLDAEGRLEQIKLSVRISGAEASKAAGAVARSICDAMGAPIDVRAPSPLGTPSPGEDWDPVIIMSGRCSGISEGVRLSVETQEEYASDFHQLYMGVRLTP